MSGLTRLFLASVALLLGATAWGRNIALPDVVVLGEEHGNPSYRKILLESLPAFVEAGYRTFASEKPKNLQEAVGEYIQSCIELDDDDRGRGLLKIAGMVRGTAGATPETSPSGTPWEEKLEGALQPLVDAKLAGFDISLVDMDSSIMDGYLRGRRSSQEAVNGLISTLTARNRHMAAAIKPRTVLLVGRAHTGRDLSSVEQFLRKRGLTVVSLDLVGEDNGEYPEESEDADLKASPSELAREGGILPYIKNRLPLPRATPGTATGKAEGDSSPPEPRPSGERLERGRHDPSAATLIRGRAWERESMGARATGAERGLGAGDQTLACISQPTRAAGGSP